MVYQLIGFPSLLLISVIFEMFFIISSVIVRMNMEDLYPSS